MKLRVLAVVMAVALSAPAAPLYSDFRTVQQSSPSIVIGTVHYDQARGWSIDVDSTIRGPSVPKLYVSEAPHESIDVRDGERVVAFVDAAARLRWVGRKIAGSSIETGVIALSGFFDFNAHIVSPSVMTLPQLKSLLATGALSQTFSVKLAFPDGKGGSRRSAAGFFVVYDAITQRAALTGFGGVCLDIRSMHGLEWGRPRVDLDDTCPPAGATPRSLHLEGAPVGVDGAGNIELLLEPRQPMMTELEYQTLVADKSIATYVTVVQIKSSDGVWSWRSDGPLVDPWGKSHAPGGTSSSSEQRGAAMVHRDTYEFDGARLNLTQSGTGVAPIEKAVDAGTITSCTLVRKAQSSPCAMTRGPSLLVRK